jgi:hypothetical protein
MILSPKNARPLERRDVIWFLDDTEQSTVSLRILTDGARVVAAFGDVAADATMGERVVNRGYRLSETANIFGRLAQ